MLTENDSFIPCDKDIDFPVTLKKVFTEDGNEVARARAVVRTDTNQAISMVSDRYKIITHRTMLDAAEPFIRELGKPEVKIVPERKGARMLATFVFKNHTVEIGDKNRAALRITMRSGYHAGASASIEVACLVLECLNMCIASEKTIFALSVRHAGDVTAFEFPKPEIVLTAFTSQEGIMNQYNDKKLTIEQGKEFLVRDDVTNALPERSRKSIAGTWEAEYGPKQDTVWDLLQHTTYNITHNTPQLSLTGRLQRLAKTARIFNTAFAGY